MKVKAILDSGGLVPDETTIEIVRDRLTQSDCKTGYLLDGFPRTVVQAEALSTFETLDAVVNFVLDDGEIVARLSGRRVCKSLRNGVPSDGHAAVRSRGSATSAAENSSSARTTSRPPSKNGCGFYAANTQPLIEWYRNHGLLKDIDASPQPAEVLKELKKVLK